MSNTDQLIPDNEGTIYLKGYEERIFAFANKKTYADTVKKEVDTEKAALRDLAMDTLRRAAEGAMRVCLLGKAGVSVSTTVPDYEKEGNRTPISDAAYKKFMKAGGADALEAKEEELFDVQTIAGQRSLVLTGKWVGWFEDQYIKSGKVDADKEPDLNFVDVEPSTTRRLKHIAIARLKAAATAGSAKAKKVADILLDAGLKSMVVRVDMGD